MLGASGGAGGALTRLTSSASKACFTAGTPVIMADGTTRPIEQVHPGDEILAHNPDTGADEPRQVLGTYTHQDTPTWQLTTSDGGTITTTADHPFLVETRGWVPAHDLQPGDTLHQPSPDSSAPAHTASAPEERPGTTLPGDDSRPGEPGTSGNRLTVTSITPTGTTATVHNLHTQGLHTYHITTTTGQPATVHNNCTTPAESAVYRCPKTEEEAQYLLDHGLNANSARAGDGYAYVGNEPAVWNFSRFSVNNYMDGYVKFEMDPKFWTEFGGFGKSYGSSDVKGGYEWLIPADMVDRFNGLTKNRTWVPHPENLWYL